MRYFLIVKGFLLVLIIAAAELFKSPPSFGDWCNATLECDKESLLNCKNEKCECLYEQEMFFDHLHEKCLVLPAKSCMHDFLDSGNNIRIDVLDCVENACCSSNGSCTCNGGFVQTPDGRCVPETPVFAKTCGCSDYNDCGVDGDFSPLVCTEGKCVCRNKFFPVSLDQYTAPYGGFCNNNISCDPMAGMKCANETCQCMNKTEMIFDSRTAKCVVLAGKRCTHEASEKLLDCIENASCNLGICNCNTGFYGNSEGRCVPEKGYGGICDSNQQCQSKAYLVCHRGKCGCDKAEALYDEKNGTCVARVTPLCRSYPSCVLNAKQLHTDADDGNITFCKCIDGFKESTSGLCLGGYDAKCDLVLSPCIDDLLCVNGYCKCHFPDHQVYESGKCVSYINGPCLETVNGKRFKYECPSNAECRNDYGVMECLCKKGYTRTVNGVCKKAYGESCSSSHECHQYQASSNGSEIICKNGKCSCGDFRIHNKKLNGCLSLWGGKCERDSDCTENAYCQTSHNDSESKPWICRCKPGTIVDAKRLCQPEMIDTPVNRSDGESQWDNDSSSEEE